MDKQIYLILCVLSGVLLFNTTPLTSFNSAVGDPIQIVNPPESFVVNSAIPINVVFLGFNESLIDTAAIDNDLTHWYAPMVNSPLDYAGGNFTLEIDYYLSNATTLETDFINYLVTIASVIAPPQDLLDYDPTAVGAYLFSAVDTLTWLDNHVNDYFGAINDSYCLYFIDSYTWGYITDYYYYDLEFLDPDTGLDSPESLTTVYGGEYPNRGVFLDLSAGPVQYHETQTTEANEGVSATTITPIWEYVFPAAKSFFNANLTEYIQETIDMVFTPSYLYEPAIKDQYDVTVYILDNTSTGYVYADPTAYIDTTTVTSSLEALIPSADWTTNYYVDYLSNHGALAQVISDAYAATDPVDYPNAIHPYDSVIAYLDTHRAEFLMTTETIPVFVFAWDEYLYFDFAGAIGGAEADASGNPLMVLCGYNPATIPDSGYTKLVIHEMGHILGLRHAHDGWSWDKYSETGNPISIDWLRDLISTPMTYAHQDTVFSTFDYDSLDRGHCFERLNDSWYYLYAANITALLKGYTDIDSTLDQQLEFSLTNHSLALQAFEAENFESAFYYANLSYVAAIDYALYIDSLEEITTTTTTTTATTTTTTVTTTTGDSTTSETSTTTTTQASTPSFTFLHILVCLVITSILLVKKVTKNKR